MPRKSAIIVSREFPPFVGGAATYAFNLANALVMSGYQVHVIAVAPNKKPRPNPSYADELTITWLPFIPKVYLIFQSLCAAWYRYRIKPDAIILADFSALKSFAAFPIYSHPNIWAVFHGSEPGYLSETPSRSFKTIIGRERMGKLMSALAGRIAVSDELAGRITETFPQLKSRVDVVAHGIDTSFFTPVDCVGKASLRKQLGLRGHSKVLFSASRLVKTKGQDNILVAFNEVSTKFPDSILVIGGDGPERVVLEKTADEFAPAVRNRIRFVGNLTRTEMRDWYRAADLFVLPSEYESFGLVFLEANSCGTMCIAGNVGGVTQLIEEAENGFLVPPGSISELTKAIANFLAKKSVTVAHRQNLHARVVQNHSLEKMGQRTICLIERNRGEQ